MRGSPSGATRSGRLRGSPHEQAAEAEPLIAHSGIDLRLSSYETDECDQHPRTSLEKHDGSRRLLGRSAGPFSLVTLRSWPLHPSVRGLQLCDSDTPTTDWDVEGARRSDRGAKRTVLGEHPRLTRSFPIARSLAATRAQTGWSPFDRNLVLVWRARWTKREVGTTDFVERVVPGTAVQDVISRNW